MNIRGRKILRHLPALHVCIGRHTFCECCVPFSSRTWRLCLLFVNETEQVIVWLGRRGKEKESLKCCDHRLLCCCAIDLMRNNSVVIYFWIKGWNSSFQFFLLFGRHLLWQPEGFWEHLQLLTTSAGLQSVSEHQVWQFQSGRRVCWVLQSFC